MYLFNVYQSYKLLKTSATSFTQMFVVVPGQENGGYTSDRSVSKAADGHYRATIATQTPDVTLTHPQHCQETQLGFAAGIPLSADMSSVMYHGAWPIHKGASLLLFTSMYSLHASSVLFLWIRMSYQFRFSIQILRNARVKVAGNYFVKSIVCSEDAMMTVISLEWSQG